MPICEPVCTCATPNSDSSAELSGGILVLAISANRNRNPPYEFEAGLVQEMTPQICCHRSSSGLSTP